VVRTEESRVDALGRKEKARRAGFGDLVVLINPAIEASEYLPFDDDLPDKRIECSSPDCHDILMRRRLPYDKMSPYSKLQMPVLMTIASEADASVGQLFPIARWLQAIGTLHLNYFFRKADWTGMGHYGLHVTHSLSAPVNKKYGQERHVISKKCSCPEISEGLSEMPPLHVKLNSEEEPISIGGNVKFGLIKDRLRNQGWDVNSPYIVVKASKGVIGSHNDIFTPTLVAFLRAYIEAYDTKYDSLPPEIQREIKGIKEVDYKVEQYWRP
jgi:hypothetical protein